MQGDPVIDTAFDVRTDSGGRDPDSHSRTLRRYHQLLWSKPLPDGRAFQLDARLHHQSSMGEFWLCSDAITHTYNYWSQPRRLVEIIQQIPQREMTVFFDLGCTVGSYLVFPSQKHLGGKWRQSINQSRGVHPKIRDRFDLTLECIRRYYLRLDSPLAECLDVYQDFFALFGSFRGYVEHFLLQDLVDDTLTSIRFFEGPGDFSQDPLPVSGVDGYREYMAESIRFIRARNRRIAAYADAHLD